MVSDPQAMCMDGSPPAYYYRQGFDGGEKKWHIHFEGQITTEDTILTPAVTLSSIRSPLMGKSTQPFISERSCACYIGGGWCYSLRQCIRRSKTGLGSSVNQYDDCIQPQNVKYYQSMYKDKNPTMYNWNMVHVRYCDGSSYAGDAVVEYEVSFKARESSRAV